MESAGSVRGTIHAALKMNSSVPQWHYCIYAQERPAEIYCAVSDNTKVKPMYKVGEVDNAALNEPCLLFHNDNQGRACKIY